MYYNSDIFFKGECLNGFSLSTFDDIRNKETEICKSLISPKYGFLKLPTITMFLILSVQSRSKLANHLNLTTFIQACMLQQQQLQRLLQTLFHLAVKSSLTYSSLSLQPNPILSKGHKVKKEMDVILQHWPFLGGIAYN